MNKIITLLIVAALAANLLHAQKADEDEDAIKPDRPDLALEQDIRRTLDPSLGYVPYERLKAARSMAVHQRRQKNNNPSLLSTATWVERGPSNVGGRTRAIMFDPNDVTHKKIWAGGVDGGLWQAPDITVASPAWTNVNDFWANIAVTCIAYDPNATLNFYVGTGEGWFNSDAVQGDGIWKTADGGVTWSQLGSTNNSTFYFVEKIVVDGSGNVFAATRNGGVQRSVDGGSTWAQVLGSGFGSVSNRGADLEIGVDGTIYASMGISEGTADGVYSSTNGTSWTKLNTGSNGFPTAGFSRVELGVAPSDANRLYAMVQSSNNSLLNVYTSVNKGLNWTVCTLPSWFDQDCSTPSTDMTRTQAWYDLIIAIDPANENNVLIGGVDVMKSTDGGLTWTQLSSWWGGCGYPEMHADQHAMQFQPGSSSNVVFGNDGGIYYSSNVNTATPAFNDANSGYNVTQFYSCAIHPASGQNYFLAGAQDNGTQEFSSAGMNATTEPTGGDGALCFIDQTNPTYQVSAYVYNTYYWSSDGGANFSTINNDQKSGSFINPADYDDANHILYSAYSTDSLERITGLASTPGPVEKFMITGMTSPASVIRVSPYAPSGTTTLFVGTTNGVLFKVSNAQTGAVPSVASIGGASFPSGSISCVELGASEQDLLVTFSNFGVVSVWRTTNGGTSWANEEGNLPDMPVRWAMYNPNNFTEVYLATEVGIWSTSDVTVASPVWVSNDNGLANVRVYMLKRRAADNEVIAATHGRGLFSTSVFGGISPTITSFSPADGPPGTLITVNGTNMGGLTAFSVGGAAAIVISNTGTQLVGLVMPGAVTGTVSLTTAGGVATTGGDFIVVPTPFPGLQQGSKLVGSGASGGAYQGQSVSISADGNTAIVGGYEDASGTGAAWIYVRSAGAWAQQGSKLVGSGAIGAAFQGASVSISADGNTAIVGGYDDNSGAGAAWVYTRSAGVWAQQGAKLVGSGATGNATQGASVSISADGNTAVVGGYSDNSGSGAIWIFTRSAGAWAQQGSKLVGTGATGNAGLGYSVSVSADGKTVIGGGTTDNSSAGAVWIYTVTAGVWSQQGSKLVGTGATGAALQGYSVALSADGNFAIVGGDEDNSDAGAAWIYSRSAGAWAQVGTKLTGTGGTAAAFQGSAVSISADGTTAIVGGYVNNGLQGATWVYNFSAGVWNQEGTNLVGTGAVGSARQGWSVSLSTDGNNAILGGDIDNTNAGAAWVFIACTVPTTPVLSTSSSVNCGAQSTTLNVVSGILNSATNWQWYSGSCGGTSVGSGTSISVSPAVTTTYYARGEGGCVTPGVCASITITVNAVPSVSLSSATGTDNQNVCTHTAISGIAYSIGVPASGATVTGLPLGVSGVYNAGVFTISGTPSVSGVFNYTVTSTGGGCASQGTINGILTVDTLPYVQLPAPWILQNSNITGIDKYIYQLLVISPTVVWATTNINEFTNTTNGGTTWTNGTVTGSSGYNYSNLSAVNKDTAWACMFLTSAAGGDIFRTFDGGLTWSVPDNTIYKSSTSFPDVVHFYDGKTGFCLGDPVSGSFEIYTSTNSGNSWTVVPTANIPAPLGGETGLTGVDCVFNNTVWCGTTEGRVLKTADKGLTWTVSAPFASSVDVITIAFRDSLNGIVVGAGSGNIMRTTDGGLTWNTFTSAGSWAATSDGESFIYVKKSASRPGFYLTGSTSGTGKISSYSSDDGATWAQLDTLSHYCFAFYDAGTGWTGAYPFTQQASIYKTNGNFFNVLSLSSDPGTTGQTVCFNSAIDPVIYSVGGTATGAGVTGLPPGVIGVYNSGTFTISGTPTVGGIYTYTVTSKGGSCSPQVSASGTITVNAPTIACIGNQTGNTSAGLCSAVVTYGASAFGGAPVPTLSYIFSGVTTGAGGGDGSGSIFNLGVTTVTLSASNSCGAVNCSFTVTVSDNINPSITAPADVVVCSGTSISLGTPVTSDNCSVASVTNNHLSGTYPVGATPVIWTVTDGSGNTATATQQVTVNALPTATITPGGPTTFCQGGDVLLTSSSGSSYLWSTGDVTQAITVSVSGRDSVEVTDGNGCTSASSVAAVVVVNICTGINPVGSNYKVVVYPNPNGGMFVVESSAAEKQLLQLFDVTGKLVLSQYIVPGRSVIDAGVVADGMYDVCISGSGGRTNMRLVIAR